MSLDVKRDVIFNTFSGLEEQLSDPDPVKEVRNYRWALRQQTIMFQNFLNEMKLEKEAFEQSYAEKFEEESAKRNEIVTQLKEDISKLEKQIEDLEALHVEEIKYQSSLTNVKLKEQEDALRQELEPEVNAFAQQIRDAVRQEEVARLEKHLRELFLLTQQKSVDLASLSTQLREYADSIDKTSGEFATYLKESGAKEYKVKTGARYVPARHEIVGTITDNSLDFNTVVEMRESGYAYKSRPLVRAQVIVNVAPENLNKIKKDIRVSEKKVRENIKELIEEFQSHGDVALVRKRQQEMQQINIGEEVEPLSDEEYDVAMGPEEYTESLETEEPLEEEEAEPEETPRQRRKRLKWEKKEAKRLAKLRKEEKEVEDDEVVEEAEEEAEPEEYTESLEAEEALEEEEAEPEETPRQRRKRLKREKKEAKRLAKLRKKEKELEVDEVVEEVEEMDEVEGSTEDFEDEGETSTEDFDEDFDDEFGDTEDWE